MSRYDARNVITDKGEKICVMSIDVSKTVAKGGVTLFDDGLFVKIVYSDGSEDVGKLDDRGGGTPTYAMESFLSILRGRDCSA